jgi:hypothetical protein
MSAPCAAAAARPEHLAQLQRLAEACRGISLENLAETVARLDAELEAWRGVQDSLRSSICGLEERVAALETSAPSPQLWRDIIQGIRSVRESVAQIQMGSGAKP